MNLYDRTHAAVLDVNGYTPDGEGHLFIPDIQDVTDLREDVEDLKEGEEGLIAAVNQQAQSIQDLSGSVESIESELSSHDGRITTNTQNIANDRQYLEAVADDLSELSSSVNTPLSNYSFKGIVISNNGHNFHGLVTYTRIGPKRGLLSAVIVVNNTASAIFDYFTLQRLGGLLNLNFKNPTTEQFHVGHWRYYKYQDHSIASDAGSNGEYLSVATNGTIYVGRAGYDGPDGNYGGWPFSTWSNRIIEITDVPVEEI